LGLGWDVPYIGYRIQNQEESNHGQLQDAGLNPAISLKRLLNAKKRQFFNLFSLGNIKQIKFISAGNPNMKNSRLFHIIVDDIITHNLGLIITGV
jgi:hypothetical protein